MMIYRRNTAAAVAILTVLLLLILLVCAPRPYSGKVWLEMAMILASGGFLGCVVVRLQSKSDSSLPVSVAAAGATFRYFLFVAVLALLPIFSVDIKFKYYALVHGMFFGVWAIRMLLLGMGVRSIDEQDQEIPNMMEMRRACHLRLSSLIDKMRNDGMKDETLLKDMSRLNDRFRLGFGKGGKDIADADARIVRLLDKLDMVIADKDMLEVRRVVNTLELEFDGRERAARM